MILCLFPYPEVRTGGHKRYLELVRGLSKQGRKILLLKHRSFSSGIEGIQEQIILSDKKPGYLPRSFISGRGLSGS